MRTIRWGQVTRSGLCDRLEDLLLMAAYARCKNARLLVDWPEFEAKDIDVAHRSHDILLENIQKFMTFPADVCFTKDGHEDEHFGSYLGAEVKPEAFYKSHLHHWCSFQQLKNELSQSAKEFMFCQPIKGFLATLPPKFITFHIRRGDKVRLAKEHDGTFILKDELYELDRLTFRAMEYFADKFKHVFICGDEDAKLKPFIGLADDLNLEIIKIPEMPKWESTFYDLAVMTRSDTIICSQRYSSFSHFPSVLGGGQFNTVYDLKEQGVI